MKPTAVLVILLAYAAVAIGHAPAQTEQPDAWATVTALFERSVLCYGRLSFCNEELGYERLHHRQSAGTATMAAESAATVSARGTENRALAERCLGGVGTATAEAEALRKYQVVVPMLVEGW